MIFSDSKLVRVPGFYIGSSFHRKNRHGGSCILVRNRHRCKNIDEIGKYNKEGIIECSGIELLDHGIYIFCIYRPPRTITEDFEIFFNNFSSLLDTFAYVKKKLIICGDFNINVLLKYKESTTFKEILSSYNLNLALNEPTRPKSGKCIDNFIYNIRGSKCKVFEFALSDHTAQVLTCPVKPSSVIKYWYIEKRDYSKENIDKFKQCINSLYFCDILNCNNPDYAFDMFYELFTLFYYLCFPITRIKIPAQRRPKWISKGIRKCCKRKRQLLWKYRKCRNETNKSNFTALSSRLNRIIRLTQKSQNENYINTARNKCKATWDIINQTKLNLPKEEIQQIKINDRIITDPLNIATTFNDFFIDQVSSLKNIDFKAKLANNYNSMFMSPTIPNDILKIITNLKNTNSTGYDDISSKILKQVANKISSVLCHIINLCIVNGVFPSKLKTTIVKPIFKKDNKNDMACYRPIALIPVLSKIFEKVIFDRVYEYFENHKLFATEQVGFRKNKSINQAIYNFLEAAMSTIDNNSISCALYMDLSKAFDFVDHRILIRILNSYGIRGNVSNLIESYLSNRKQMTQITRICPKSKIESKYVSSLRRVSVGVPQGSILGPLLFIIYINNLPKISKHQTIMFADDSTIVFTGNNKSVLESDINNTLSDIIKWLTSINLKINISKTNVMIFRNRTVRIKDIDINYLGQKVKRIDSTKFLGLFIDSNFDWHSHVESLCHRLSQQSYALYMLSKVSNSSTVITAYHGYAASILRYAIIFWGNSTGKESVFKAQKKCVRAICKLKQTDSCKPFFVDLNILTLPSLYIYEIALFVKKNMSLFNNFKSQRHGSKICCPKSSTALYNNSVFCMAPRIFNHLPKHILEIDQIHDFKLKLKKVLLQKAYYTIDEYLMDKLQ